MLTWRLDRLPLLGAAVIVGTAGWFFFQAICALVIRRNDAFNTVTPVFYCVFLSASSKFRPLECRRRQSKCLTRGHTSASGSFRPRPTHSTWSASYGMQSRH